MRDLIDKDHKVMDDYYELLERYEEGDFSKVKMINELKKLIKEDPYFFDSYSSLYLLLSESKKEKEAIKLLNEGYKKSLEVILDKKGEWPDSMEWGFLENRHVIRIILNKAILEWELEDNDVALDLFRNLLRTNPRDNAGVRFYILAIKMKMTFDDYEEKFNRGGYYDSDSWKWFNENVESFSDEFGEWMNGED
tara:strand:+ start:3751 stop:4332 length:582 start_codon:yes stop_codon:yes gene_type:complete